MQTALLYVTLCMTVKGKLHHTCKDDHNAMQLSTHLHRAAELVLGLGLHLHQTKPTWNIYL